MAWSLAAFRGAVSRVATNDDATDVAAVRAVRHCPELPMLALFLLFLNWTGSEASCLYAGGALTVYTPSTGFISLIRVTFRHLLLAAMAVNNI